MLRSLTAAFVGALAAFAAAACGGSHQSALRQQAGWGEGVYAVNCARCHDPGRSAGELTTTRLVSSFVDAGSLQQFVLREMPYDRRGILNPTDAWAVTAWLLDRNRLLRLRPDYRLGPKTASTVRLGGDLPQRGHVRP